MTSRESAVLDAPLTDDCAGVSATWEWNGAEERDLAFAQVDAR